MMKHICIGAVMALIVLAPADISAADLRILAENIAPVNFIENGQWTGSNAEIVKEIIRRQDLEAQIEEIPWARGYQMALTQPNVVLFTMARTPEREDRFHWVGPLGTFRSAFYARRDSGIVINSIADARAVGRIGIYRGDVREDYLLDKGFDNLDRTNSNASNLRKLINGRIDLWATSTMEAASLPRQLDIDSSAIEHVHTFQKFQMYIAISKRTPLHTVTRWQETLKAMEADGTLMAICRRWLPEEDLPETASKTSLSGNDGLQLTIYTENSPPGSYVEEGRLQGPAVRVVEEILRRLGLKSTIQVVPWARGYHLARTQPNVALFATSRLPQREALFKWVGPLYIQRWGFYAPRQAALDIQTMEEARAVARIGTYRQDAKEAYLKSLGFRNLVSTNNNIGNVRHLMEGEIDMWVSSDFNMPWIVRYAGYDPRDLKLVLSLKTVGNYIAFSPLTADHIVACWQETLDAIRRDGTWARHFENNPLAVE